MAFTTRQAASEQKSAQEAAAKPSAQLFSDQRASTGVQLKQQQLMQTAQLAGMEEEPLQGKFVAQRVEEEEPLQGKFATAQLAGMEEEPLQGKFVAQRAEEEEPLQGKFATAQLTGMEEEEPIQGKFEPLQRAAEEEEPLQGKFESATPVQREQKSNNTGMPDNLKSGIENLSGYSMDDVKVHYNSDRPAQLNAHAYAQGTDIHVAPGQEQHLPHEAWHVVQQKQGRVQPTMQMKAGVPVNDDAGLENEADVMGAKAASVQLKAYKKEVTVGEVITSADLNDWGVVRRKLGAVKGGDADSSIARGVNDSLTALGLAKGSAMSAHMIPNRLGGQGDSSNVRPWDKTFEAGKWETDVEQKFNSALVGKAVGTKLSYDVNTTEMTDEDAQKIIDKSTVDAAIKGNAEHKKNIKEIPVKVSANAGGSALAETDECFKGLV